MRNLEPLFLLLFLASSCVGGPPKPDLESVVVSLVTKGQEKGTAKITAEVAGAVRTTDLNVGGGVELGTDSDIVWQQVILNRKFFYDVIDNPERYEVDLAGDGKFTIRTRRQEPTPPSVTIGLINIRVNTTDDNKEDSQFELIVKQGAQVIASGKWGAGQNWDDGSEQMLQLNAGVVLSDEPITVIAVLQDGEWGRSNHWNCNMWVTVKRSRGSDLVFEGNGLQFRTGGSRRRHEISLGTKTWPVN